MKKLKIILQCNVTYFFLFLFLCFFVLVFTQFIQYESKFAGDETKIKGIVKSYKITDTKLIIEVDSIEPIICNYYFKDKKVSTKNLIGSEIELDGKLSRPNSNTLPNTFNYKRYLYNKGIFYTFSVSNFTYEENLNIFYKLKNKMYDRIKENNKVNEYLNLFILGNKSLLDKDIYNNYLANGVVHLFAISGMHVSIITYTLDKLIRWRKKKSMICLILWLYSFIVSFSISILRSVIFYTLKYIFNYFNINTSNLKLLFLTMFVILMINPFNIYEVGFLYSFITVFSIFYCSNNITGNYFAKLLKTSFIIFVFTLPITASLNFEINLFSIFNNLIFIPLVTFVIYPVSIITYIFPLFNFIYELLLSIMELLNNILFNIDIFTIVIPKINIFLILIYYLLIILLKDNKRIYFVFLFVFLIKIIVKVDFNNYFYFLDQTTPNMIQGLKGIFARKPLISRGI